MADVVKVTGLKELQKALKQVADVESRKELKDGLKAAAGIVADDARKRVPQRSGRAAKSLRAGATTKGAYVAGGKKTVPYYGWLDFGSRTPVAGNARSVGPWAGTGQGPAKGRFIYPALDAKYGEVVQAVDKAIDEVTKKIGLT